MIRPISAMDYPVERPRRSRRLRWFLAFAVVTVGVGALALPRLDRWWRADAVLERAAQRFSTVTRGDLVRDFGAQGRIVAASHPTLYAAAPGLVSRLVRPGQAVTAGQAIARIDSPELTSRRSQESSRLASLVADLDRERLRARQQVALEAQAVDLARVRRETAERGMLRADRSRAEGILNAVQYEAAQDALEVARLELAAAEQAARLAGEAVELDVRQRAAEVERQRLVLAELDRQVAELELRSPVDGLVGDFAVEERDAVASGQAVVGVVDLSAFEVEIQVPETYARELVPGSPAEVLHDGRTWNATVHTVSPQVESGQVRCTLGFGAEAPADLRQGQRVTARLVFETRRDVLKVARGPFLEAGAGRFAWVVDGDYAHRRAIEVGATSVGEVEIVAGLAVGDTVLLSDTSRFPNAQSLLLRD